MASTNYLLPEILLTWLLLLFCNTIKSSLILISANRLWAPKKQNGQYW